MNTKQNHQNPTLEPQQEQKGDLLVKPQKSLQNRLYEQEQARLAQKTQTPTLEQPTDVYTVSYEEADSIKADYITQSELEAMGLSVGDIEQGGDDEQ